MASTLKFQAQASNGRPQIFWEESNQDTSKKKKFDYKKKEQPFTLRNKKTAPQPPTHTKQPTNQPKTQNDIKKSHAKSKIDTGLKKKEETPKPDPNMVTLTQKEFDAILETIGKLALEAEDPGGTVGMGNERSNKMTTNEADDPLPLPPSPSEPPRHSGVEHPVNTGRSDRSKKEAFSSVPQPVQQQQVPPVESTYMYWGEKPPIPVDDKPNTVPVPLSKAELKKLQWQKERAELDKMDQNNYDPWGRPGAGAPMKDKSGNTLADYNARKDQSSTQQQNQQASLQNTSKPNENNSSHLAPNALLIRQSLEDVTNRAPPGPQQPQRVPAPMAYPTLSPRQQADADRGGAPPAAIRSSFTVGAIAPDEDRFTSAKDIQKKAWLAELEKQREEQRQRKLQEKALKNQEEIHDTWADRFTTIKSSGLPEQSPRGPPQSTVNEVAVTATMSQAHGGPTEDRVNRGPPEDRVNRGPPEDRVNSAPLSTRLGEPDNDTSTFIRGQNAFMDQYTKHELDDKRRKHLEHQSFIKQQIEERERLKREEREKRIREELEDEAKFQRERDMQANQTEKAHQKTKDKELAERQRLEAMKAAMNVAKAEAEREKLENRLRKLQKAGHDVSQLERTYEAQPNQEAKGITPRIAAANLPHQAQGAVHVEPAYIPGLNPTPREVTHAEPTGVPGLGLSMGSSLHTGVDNAAPSPNYYRSPRNEEHDGHRIVREESTEIEYNGPIKERKKVRVKSAPKENRPSRSMHSKVPHREQRDRSKSNNEGTRERRKAHWELNEENTKKPHGPLNVTERPGWGAPTKKKVLKQSERDPNYQRRKLRIEASRKERQLQMQAMAAKNAHKVPVTQTVASRNRSRSRDRDSSGDRGRSVSPAGPTNQQFGKGSPLPEARALSPEDDLIESHRSRADGHNRTGQRQQRGHHSQGAASYGQSPHVPALALRLRPDSPEQVSSRRSYSPPIPAIKHKTNMDYNADPHRTDVDRGEVSQRSTGRNKYGDTNPIHPPISDGDFVPFLRTNDILDPVHAESPLPVSREPSAVMRGRKAYVHEQNPAEYGNHMNHFSDKRLKDMMSPAPGSAQADRWVNPNAVETKDPLYNPGLVTDNPTTRQGQILQQLSSLRRGLMQKQRELEEGLPGPAEIAAGGEDF